MQRASARGPGRVALGASLGFTLWRAQFRETPLRSIVTILAIALGVALSAGVWLVNAGALAEFGRATRRLVGEADLVVRGPRSGFDEALYARLARVEGVAIASPVLELDVAIADDRNAPRDRIALRVLALDPFRAAAVQPTLLADLAGEFTGIFEPDGIFLSASAAQSLSVKRGERFDVLVGTDRRSLRVLGVLSAASYPQRLGIMDVAAAQWSLGRVGRLNRIDLRLSPDASATKVRAALAPLLPAGVAAVEPEFERDRAVTFTRAYRVNLNMLALVSLLTGAFLVLSTQGLSVLRRRVSLGLLRALGVTRAEIELALAGEGVLVGAIGAAIGVALGHVSAAAMLRLFAGDFGNGQISASGAGLAPQPIAWLAFFVLGTAFATLGAWIPAREAARRAPARALKAGDAEHAAAAVRPTLPGIALLLAGAGLAFAPAVRGIPVFGYVSIAALLFGGVMLVPTVVARVLARAPRSRRASLDLGLAQLRGSVGQSTLGLAAVIVSFSLMVAMAIMVYSFRVSFEHWLDRLLPADVLLRTTQGSDTAWWSEATQTRIRDARGITRAEFRRTLPILLSADRLPVTLIARDLDRRRVNDALPLVASVPIEGDATPVWISEAITDLYGHRAGATFSLPLDGRPLRVRAAGVFRDYGRSTGAIVMERAEYARVSGDRSANEASLWIANGATARDVDGALRAAIGDASGTEIRTSDEVRRFSLQAFDRAFAITYALEAVAVLIGLVGVSFAASSAALARRAEFGMLRHVGMLRRQIVAMLASEGLLTSTIGVAFGLVLGGGLSLVLVYVVNRQSFGWSVDLAVPWLELAYVSLALVTAAAVTATLSGRAATRTDAVRAVREDW